MQIIIFVINDEDDDDDDDDADNDDDEDDGDGDDELEVVELLGRVTSYLISASLTIAMLSSILFFGNSFAVQCTNPISDHFNTL